MNRVSMVSWVINRAVELFLRHCERLKGARQSSICAYGFRLLRQLHLLAMTTLYFLYRPTTKLAKILANKNKKFTSKIDKKYLNTANY